MANLSNLLQNVSNSITNSIKNKGNGTSSTVPRPTYSGGTATVTKPTYSGGTATVTKPNYSGNIGNIASSVGSALGNVGSSIGSGAVNNSANKNQTNPAFDEIANAFFSGIGNNGYTPLDNSGFDYAGSVNMSNADRTAISAAKELYNRGQALGDKNMMNLAHQQAESIRKKYGYSGGTDGSMYILDETMLMPEFQIPNYDEFYAASGYGDAADALNAATNAYIQQLQQTTGAQSQQANQNYDEAARQAYISYMNSRRTLPQRLSAMGSTGGMADSQQIALDAELQNNQNNIELQRQNALQELQNLQSNNTLAAQQQLWGNMANLGQQAASDYQNFYQNEANRYYNQFNQNRDFNTTQDLTQQQAQQAQQQQMWENALALWQTYGYATQTIANVLGVPVGALPEGTAYNNALLELEMIKAGM